MRAALPLLLVLALPLPAAALEEQVLPLPKDRGVQPYLGAGQVSTQITPMLKPEATEGSYQLNAGLGFDLPELDEFRTQQLMLGYRFRDVSEESSRATRLGGAAPGNDHQIRAGWQMRF